MAPLPYYSMRLGNALIFSLFVSTLLASYFFVLSTSHPHYYSLGRRNLLASKKIDVDDGNDDDFLGEIIPRKKNVLDSSEDGSLVKNKSSVEKDETSGKKKKSSSFNEGESKTSEKKKMSSSSSLRDDDDDDVKQVPTKKKSSNLEDGDKQPQKKKLTSTSLSSNTSSKNQTKSIKAKASNLDTNSSKKDEAKLVNKPSSSTSSSKNKTKLATPTSKVVDESSKNTPTITKSKLNKLNSTSKSSNPTKTTSKKSLAPPKSNSTANSKTKSSLKSLIDNAKLSQFGTPDKKPNQKSQNQDQKRKSPSSPNWLYQNDEDEDLVSEFRDLPTKFHQSFIPDLNRISTTSKVYLTKYNKEITQGFKPYVGNKYAPSLATAISCVFIIVPFLLVSLLFNRIKAYFSLQKLIIFIQIYLSIYFTILCLSSLFTGLEPLRFFYATSQSTYVWLQVLQTLAYVLYLLLLLMYLVLVFSTESDLGQKFLGLGQTFVGFAVGLHYYMTVFHRVVLRQPPKTNWKFHGIYATCFLVICLLASAERRKKAYVVEGSEEGKMS